MIFKLTDTIGDKILSYKSNYTNNKPLVTIRQGEGREDNIKQVLKDLSNHGKLEKLITKNLSPLGKDKRFILIKPNFVSVRNQLAASHKNAIKPVLSILNDYDLIEKVIIGEIAALSDAKNGFETFGYSELVDEFGNWVELIDLDYEEMVKTWIYDSNFKKITVDISKVMIGAPLRISVSPPKTHNVVVVTLGWKNLAVGCMKRSDKMSIHQGYKAVNFNIFKLGTMVFPHLVILDGYEAMEGEGPLDGNPVNWNIAIASENVLAADSLATTMMGFNSFNVGACLRNRIFHPF